MRPGHFPHLLLLLGFIAYAVAADEPTGSVRAKIDGPVYTADGKLIPPQDYREWIFLSSGMDMSYSPAAKNEASQSSFDNVFANPEAYRTFLKTGTWPDKTMLVLEVRRAGTNVSPNKGGHFQGRAVSGTEIHVKDAARGGWAFYDMSGTTPAKRIHSKASCYSCHQEHAAVDTTFVQFYPTLLPVAEKMKTVSPGYSASGSH